MKFSKKPNRIGSLLKQTCQKFKNKLLINGGVLTCKSDSEIMLPTSPKLRML